MTWGGRMRSNIGVLPKINSEGGACGGIVFRGYASTFASGNHIGQRSGIKLLKRKSCPGCIECGGILDYMMESIRESIDTDSLIMPEIEHGKLYSARLVNMSTDWETGYVDDYDVEIYEVEA